MKCNDIWKSKCLYICYFESINVVQSLCGTYCIIVIRQYKNSPLVKYMQHSRPKNNRLSVKNGDPWLKPWDKHSAHSEREMGENQSHNNKWAQAMQYHSRKWKNHGENHLIISDLAIPKLNHLFVKWSVISSCPLTHLTTPPWHLKDVREPHPLSGLEFLLWLWLRLPRFDDSKHSLKLISASRDPLTSFSSSFDLTVAKT